VPQGQFRAVVAANRLWLAVECDQLSEHLRNAPARRAGGRIQHPALPDKSVGRAQSP
jgi:hypothetical protein